MARITFTIEGVGPSLQVRVEVAASTAEWVSGATQGSRWMPTLGRYDRARESCLDIERLYAGDSPAVPGSGSLGSLVTGSEGDGRARQHP